MFNNNKINSFIVLAETLNYTKTAKRLYLSQQAVSRLIFSLEEELNAQLFVRSTRSVRLTAAGKAYYELFKRLTEEYDEGVESIKRGSADGDFRKVVLGAQSYMTTKPFISAIETIKTIAPRLSISVVCAPSSIMLDQFKRGMLDAIIVLERFVPEDFEACRFVLAENPLFLMVSPDNPAATDDASYEDFLTLPYISDMVEGEDDLAHNARMQRELRMWNINTEEVRWAYDRDSAYMYAEFGYGIIIDTVHSTMFKDRNLKMYDTGQTESLYLLSRCDSVGDKEIEILTRTIVDTFHAFVEEVKRAKDC